METCVAAPVRQAFFRKDNPASLVSNWKFFQRADNIEGVLALSRGKEILK